MPEKPSPDAAMHQPLEQQVPPQQQPADNSVVLSDPVQQLTGVLPQMQQPQSCSQKQPQSLQAVTISRQPIQPSQPLGSSVLAPALQLCNATPYRAASGLKVSWPCIPEYVAVLHSCRQHHLCHLICASSNPDMTGAS